MVLRGLNIFSWLDACIIITTQMLCLSRFYLRRIREDMKIDSWYTQTCLRCFYSRSVSRYEQNDIFSSCYLSSLVCLHAFTAFLSAEL